MFSEWTDPHDIDNYYSDLTGAFKSYSALPSNNIYQQLPQQRPVAAKVEIVPEKPTGVVINSPTENKLVNGGVLTLHDEHPVGKQPEYNILRSGPKESFNNVLCPDTVTPNWLFVVVTFIFFVLLCYQISSLKCCIAKLTKKLNKTATRLDALHPSQM